MLLGQMKRGRLDDEIRAGRNVKKKRKARREKKRRNSPYCAAGRWRHRRPPIPRWLRETSDSRRRTSSPRTTWIPWYCRNIARASGEFRTRGGTCWCAPRGKTYLHLLCNYEAVRRERREVVRGSRCLRVCACARAGSFVAIIFNKLSSYTRTRYGRGRRVKHPRSL